MGVVLRDYQEEAITKFMASWSLHCETLEKYKADTRYGLKPETFQAGVELFVLATGAGKTVIFCEIIRLLAEQGIPSLVLVHRDDLLDQAIAKYRAIKPDAIVGKVKGSQCELGGELTVASVQTAKNAKKLKALQRFNYGLIVVDEGHHIAAQGYQTVLRAFPMAFTLIVTATPDRLDNKPIIDKLPLVNKGIADLVRAGHLCPPKAIAIRTDVSLDEVRTLGGDFNEHDLSEAVDTPARNRRIVDAYVEHASGMAFIAFCITVAHAQSLAYTFNDHGIPVAVVTGETSADDRKTMYQQVQDGDLLGLVSVQVLTEGFDLPKIQCIIMARPTKSRSLYVQCVGRGARLFPGKEYFIVLDITDNCMKHRLTPHNLNKALELKMLNDETLLEADEREEEEAKEAEEKRKQVRKLKEKRKQDIIIDLLQKFEWKKRDADGAYILNFGEKQHKMALQCHQGTAWGENDGIVYDVWQALAPDFLRVKLTSVALSLDEALQYAEKQVIKVGSDEMKALYLASAAPRRLEMPTPAQTALAMRLGIPFSEETTRGELSDLISDFFDAAEKRKAAAKAAKEAKKQAV